jgi:hypothetical protein
MTGISPPYGRYKVVVSNAVAFARWIDRFNEEHALNLIYVEHVDYSINEFKLRINSVGWNFLVRNAWRLIRGWVHYKGPDYPVNQTSLLDTADYTDTDYNRALLVGAGGDNLSITNVPPPLPKENIASTGTQVKITAAHRVKDVRTSLGVVSDALTVEVQSEGDKTTYSYLWDISKDPISGSVGRILTAAGFKNRDQLTDAGLKKLVGMAFTVKNKGGKLYWY